MNKKIRIKDIAKVAGVSPGTVDRVIHNRGQVTEENRLKILQIIDELGYQPNMLARTLANKKSYLLVSLCPEYKNENDYWKAPDDGIGRAAAEISDYNVVLKRFYFDQFSVESYKKRIGEVLAEKPDGIILSPVFVDETLGFAKELEKQEIPYVFIDSNIDGLNNLSYLGQNSFQSGFLAARLLNLIISPKSHVMIISSAVGRPSNQSVRREDGIYEYFSKANERQRVERFDLLPQNAESLERFKTLVTEKNVGGIIVINSRTFEIANILEQINSQSIKLIGYDLLPENIQFLKKDTISFLIAQRPEEQGYKGVMALFENLVIKSKVEKDYFLPIDILTSENIDYYLQNL